MSTELHVICLYYEIRVRCYWISPQEERLPLVNITYFRNIEWKLHHIQLFVHKLHDYNVHDYSATVHFDNLTEEM